MPSALRVACITQRFGPAMPTHMRVKNAVILRV